MICRKESIESLALTKDRFGRAKVLQIWKVSTFTVLTASGLFRGLFCGLGNVMGWYKKIRKHFFHKRTSIKILENQKYIFLYILYKIYFNYLLYWLKGKEWLWGGKITISCYIKQKLGLQTSEKRSWVFSIF